jgi:hypothetical protein
MSRPSIAALGGVALFGAICIVAAHETSTPFWLGLWLNLGAASLLFVALYVVERAVLDRRVEQARVEIGDAVDRQLGELRSEMGVSIGELERRFADQIQQREQDDQTLLDAFHEQPTAATTSDMLARATALGAVSSDGPRVEIPNIYERVRFAPDGNGGVKVILERWNTEPIKTVPWDEGWDASSMFLHVAEALQAEGLYPGEGSFSPDRMLTQLAETVRIAVGARTARGTAPHDLGPVIELIGQGWAVTEDGLEALGNNRYVIERHRVHEQDWYRHMSKKSWVDADEFYWALLTARAVFAESATEDDTDAPSQLGAQG